MAQQSNIRFINTGDAQTATPVVLVHQYENGEIVGTTAMPKHGVAARSSDFWTGAWQREDGTLFFVTERGDILEGETPSELVSQVDTYKSFMQQYAA